MASLVTQFWGKKSLALIHFLGNFDADLSFAMFRL